MSSRPSHATRPTSELLWCLPLFIMTFAGLAAAEFASLGMDVSATAMIVDYASAVLLLGVLILAFALAAVAAVCVFSRQPKSLRAIAAQFCAPFPTAGAACGAVAAVAATIVLMGCFGTMKMLMPLHRHFSWDDTFAKADKFLFLGWQPWEITHAVLSESFATRAMDFIYTLWVPLLFLAVVAAVFCTPADRARFFLSFGAAWLLLGVVSAYALSSAGPCFAAPTGATSAPEFAPLMARLHEIGFESQPLNAVTWQSTLWNAHVTRRYDFAMGISAMPSMHNAIAMLYVLAMAGSRAVYRYGSWVFAILICIASVHLGWHYAVDWLVAWVAMAAIWAASGAYLRKVGYMQAVPLSDVSAQPVPEATAPAYHSGAPAA